MGLIRYQLDKTSARYIMNTIQNILRTLIIRHFANYWFNTFAFAEWEWANIKTFDAENKNSSNILEILSKNT